MPGPFVLRPRQEAPALNVVVDTRNHRERALETLRVSRGDLRVFRRSNTGFAAANNIVLEHARGRFLLWLNPTPRASARGQRYALRLLPGAATLPLEEGSLMLHDEFRRFSFLPQPDGDPSVRGC
jgi:hypothetical protein